VCSCDQILSEILQQHILIKGRVKIGEKVLFHNIEANKMPLKSRPIYVPNGRSWLTRMDKRSKKLSEVVNLLGTDFSDYEQQKIEARNVTKKNDNK